MQPARQPSNKKDINQEQAPRTLASQFQEPKFPAQGLVGDGPFRLQPERRRVPRRVVSGGAMAIFSEGHGPGRLARVDLVDASWTGLGVRSPMKIEPGSTVSIIPEHAMSPRQVGVVMRCEQEHEGVYLVGVQCRTQKTAA
jgi:hypothetical protein